ncbi:MAG: hydroxymyristoyl-ACP dehydratase [Maribacter sp.]|nr:hydroxymyristoyl-ACP dehydratase [Maribacter sp.]
MNYKDILSKLPYTRPFLFVDTLLHLDEEGVKGQFTFLDTCDFYKGHFKGNPITPGVILTECCAQIGMVCLGIYLLDKTGTIATDRLKLGMSSAQMEFFLPVYPNETVTVSSKKEYFRFNKLKCAVKMHNEKGKLICKGTLSGMLKIDSDG